MVERLRETCLRDGLYIIIIFFFKKKLDQLVSTKEEFSFKSTYNEAERIAKRQNIDEKYTGNRQRGIAYIVL
jgi:hypothetical protein